MVPVICRASSNATDAGPHCGLPPGGGHGPCISGLTSSFCAGWEPDERAAPAAREPGPRWWARPGPQRSPATREGRWRWEQSTHRSSRGLRLCGAVFLRQLGHDHSIGLLDRVEHLVVGDRAAETQGVPPGSADVGHDGGVVRVELEPLVGRVAVGGALDADAPVRRRRRPNRERRRSSGPPSPPCRLPRVRPARRRASTGSARAARPSSPADRTDPRRRRHPFGRVNRAERLTSAAGGIVPRGS